MLVFSKNAEKNASTIEKGLALTGDTVLCSWARHLALTVPPRSVNGYRRIVEKPNKLQGSDLRWTSSQSRGSRNIPGRFMLQKPG